MKIDSSLDDNLKNCANKNCQMMNPQSKDNFNKRVSLPDGLQYQCKSCSKQYYKDNKGNYQQYTEKNIDKIKAYRKLFYSQHKEQRKIEAKVYREANRDRYIEGNLKRNYNISLDDYNELLKRQNGVCKICNKEESNKNKLGTTKKLSVDHCHTTGKIRGLLCQKCNRGIGLLSDNCDILLKAYEYLKYVET